MFLQYYEINNFRFSLATDCDELKTGLDLLSPAMAARPGKCSTEWTVCRFQNQQRGLRSYRLYESGNLICETDDTIRLLDSLEWAIMTGILQNTRHLVQLHAAGVDVDGQALLFVGPSGAGKTSLVLSLLLKGWKCLSDEVILVEPGTNRVMPLPRSFHIHSRTLNLFSELSATEHESTSMDNRGKIRFDPATVLSEWVASSSAPAWVIFPCYRPGNCNDLIPIGETEAMTLLIGQTINLLDHGERGLETLMELVRNCRCFRFNTGDIQGASLAISRLVRQQASLCYCRDPRAGAEAEFNKPGLRN
jgi:hypothetical protein